MQPDSVPRVDVVPAAPGDAASSSPLARSVSQHRYDLAGQIVNAAAALRRAHEVVCPVTGGTTYARVNVPLVAKGIRCAGTGTVGRVRPIVLRTPVVDASPDLAALAEQGAMICVNEVRLTRVQCSVGQAAEGTAAVDVLLDLGDTQAMRHRTAPASHGMAAAVGCDVTTLAQTTEARADAVRALCTEWTGMGYPETAPFCPRFRVLPGSDNGAGIATAAGTLPGATLFPCQLRPSRACSTHLMRPGEVNSLGECVMGSLARDTNALVRGCLQVRVPQESGGGAAATLWAVPGDHIAARWLRDSESAGVFELRWEAAVGDADVGAEAEVKWVLATNQAMAGVSNVWRRAGKPMLRTCDPGDICVSAYVSSAEPGALEVDMDIGLSLGVFVFPRVPHGTLGYPGIPQARPDPVIVTPEEGGGSGEKRRRR